MIRALLAKLTSRYRGDEESDSTFVPSRLDASVLYAHGKGNAGQERELASVRAKAETLENQHRDQ